MQVVPTPGQPSPPSPSAAPAWEAPAGLRAAATWPPPPPPFRSGSLACSGGARDGLREPGRGGRKGELGRWEGGGGGLGWCKREAGVLARWVLEPGTSSREQPPSPHFLRIRKGYPAFPPMSASGCGEGVRDMAWPQRSKEASVYALGTRRKGLSACRARKAGGEKGAFTRGRGRRARERRDPTPKAQTSEYVLEKGRSLVDGPPGRAMDREGLGSLGVNGFGEGAQERSQRGATWPCS